jgi:hypothetical protein
VSVLSRDEIWVGFAARQISPIRKKTDIPRESEINMATQRKSSKTPNVLFAVPDPDQPSKYFHAEVGGTATWECNSVNYPKFQVSFTGSNPSNKKVNAKFPGGSNQPVVIALKHAGHFNYKVRHTKANGTHKFSGPFPIIVAPPGLFSHCGACPPGGK